MLEADTEYLKWDKQTVSGDLEQGIFFKNLVIAWLSTIHVLVYVVLPTVLWDAHKCCKTHVVDERRKAWGGKWLAQSHTANRCEAKGTKQRAQNVLDSPCTVIAPGLETDIDQEFLVCFVLCPEGIQPEYSV